MAFVNEEEIEALRAKITKDHSRLGKLYRAKKSLYYFQSVDLGAEEELLADGWEEVGRLKTKIKLRKEKSHSKRFEDDIWCQLYNLGYRELSVGSDFKLPYGKSPLDKKQIDVVAVGNDNILLVECKSSEKPSKPSSLKTEFEGLAPKLDGFKKALEQIYGKGKRVKYLFATRNMRIDRDSADIRRLESTKSFFYNDNAYEYVNGLIKSYRNAAHYQFLAMLFKGETITKDRIELPAIEGKMGQEKYYMFSIEPHLLLKMGFVLHRTRANDSEMPTYQRLLVPSRLKGISKFINDGGYFPNSVILNFSESTNRLQFEASNRLADSNSRFGTLKIPNAYAIAYIIDGQHRVYGYSQTKYKDSDTIPVVAFCGLNSMQQLKLFMEINENQKAVSPTLRITLEEDLFWDADRVDSRLKALRSSIIRGLCDESESPLYNKISIGEDKRPLSAKPFANALSHSGLLPVARGNKIEEGCEGSLYNINNHDHSIEMTRARKSVISFLCKCYEYAIGSIPESAEGEEQYVMTNRGTYAFICLLGALNKYETDCGALKTLSSAEERFLALEQYLGALMSGLKEMPEEQREYLRSNYGGGADTKWFMTFQDMVNRKFSEFEPADLIDWKERQNTELQEEGRALITGIERFIKKNVIEKLKALFGENWDLEIGQIQRDCQERARKEEERIWKEEQTRKHISWTEMFLINDYKTIIEKYWARNPDPMQPNFTSFEKTFALDIGKGFNSKAEKLKWLSSFNTYRNNSAHEGSKEKGLNSEEVIFLKDISSRLGANA